MKSSVKPAKKHRFKKPLIILGGFVAVLLFLFLLGLPKEGENPHHLVLFGQERIQTLNSITRVDEDGHLYSMEYTADYDTLFSKTIINILKLVRETACTGYTTVNEAGEVLTCRNYDFPHLDDSGSPTGANVVVSCHAEGCYRSVASADASICIELGLPVYTGSLDDNKTDNSLMILLPWLCMDGLNEKGLSVSVMSLDVLEGEHVVDQNEPGKEKVLITQMLRNMLDHCADIDEAIDYAKSVNLVNTLGGDYHLFLTDATGRSVVLEWRNNELIVVESNAATNFYLCSDDAADCWYDDYLKEAWNGPAETEREYHYGFGHGYERFKTVVTALDKKDNFTEAEAFELLSEAAQTYTVEHTSHTQYSVIYNNTTGEVAICPDKQYQTVYRFSVFD